MARCVSGGCDGHNHLPIHRLNMNQRQQFKEITKQNKKKTANTMCVYNTYNAQYVQTLNSQTCGGSVLNDNEANK